LCRGISGSFRVEWVAGFVWNQWQPWSGIRTAPHQKQNRTTSSQTRTRFQSFWRNLQVRY
ncbi:MAG: hypothetical protein CL958_04755, partial [Euryarchaeota archaeon]|nr:hypothetical protein [Marinobacter sp.]